MSKDIGIMGPLDPFPRNERPGAPQPAGQGRASVERGIAHLREADYYAAVRDFTEAIHLEPTNVDAYRGRYLAYCSLDDDVNAAADRRRLKELGADPQASYYVGVWPLVQQANTYEFQGRISLRTPTGNALRADGKCSRSDCRLEYRH